MHVVEISVQFFGTSLSCTGPDISGYFPCGFENMFLIENGIVPYPLNYEILFCVLSLWLGIIKNTYM